MYKGRERVYFYRLKSMNLQTMNDVDFSFFFFQNDNDFEILFLCLYLFVLFFFSSSCCRNNKGILGIPQSFLVPNLLNNQSDFLKFLLRHDFVHDKLDSKCVLKIVDETRYGVLRCRN